MMKNKLVKTNSTYYLVTNDKIVGSTGDSDGKMYNLSFSNCQSIEKGYNIKDMADSYGINIEVKEGRKVFDEDFIAGFETAVEILGDKKFSGEDIKKAFNVGWIQRHNEEGSHYEAMEKVIQSLQHVEWDVEIEMEKVKDETKIIGSVKGVKGSGHKITTYKSVPVFDVDGCLILRRI